jgi:mannosyl-oligosaccharide alpha-1,2-mannosidase
VACFAGGNFILGGLVLGEQKYVDFGLDLTAGCYDTYHSTLTKIGPEVFEWAPASCPSSNSSASTSVQRDVQDSQAQAAYQAHAEADAIREAHSPKTSPFRNYITPTSPNGPIETGDAVVQRSQAGCDPIPQAQSDFYAKSGFYFRDSSYDLRPEVIESYYYAYRVTGDPKYQEWAWEAFKAINATARIGAGFTQITDVNQPAGGGKLDDNQESFLFAEVMKYSYLIFAEDGPYQVNWLGEGDAESFVFNTEAHPFKVAHRGESYWGWGDNKKTA